MVALGLGLYPTVTTILGFKVITYFQIFNYYVPELFGVSARCKYLYIDKLAPCTKNCH